MRQKVSELKEHHQQAKEKAKQLEAAIKACKEKNIGARQFLKKNQKQYPLLTRNVINYELVRQGIKVHQARPQRQQQQQPATASASSPSSLTPSLPSHLPTSAITALTYQSPPVGEYIIGISNSVSQRQEQHGQQGIFVQFWSTCISITMVD
jgi:hypothetical protein